MILQISPAALMVGDEILTINANGVVTKRISVKKLEWCESHRKGIPRIHVNDTACYDGCGTLDIQRGKLGNGGTVKFTDGANQEVVKAIAPLLKTDPNSICSYVIVAVNHDENHMPITLASMPPEEMVSFLAAVAMVVISQSANDPSPN